MPNPGKKRAKVAILLRTKNRPAFLARALASISGQTCSDWALCLINDGGEEGPLRDVLAPYLNRLEGRLELLTYERQPGQGIGHLLNIGLENTDSEYVAVHDDDDSWHPEFLARALGRIGSGMALVTQSNLVRETFDGARIDVLETSLFNPWQRNAISLFRLAEGVTFPSIALLFRRAATRDIGAFDPQLTHKDDWEFSLRLLARFDAIFLEETLANFHYRTKPSQPPVSNLIMDDGRHFVIETEIRNRLLRSDIASGNFGLGLLTAMAGAHGALYREIASSREQTVPDSGDV